jgi:hypothetical protein
VRGRRRAGGGIIPHEAYRTWKLGQALWPRLLDDIIDWVRMHLNAAPLIARTLRSLARSRRRPARSHRVLTWVSGGARALRDLFSHSGQAHIVITDLRALAKHARQRYGAGVPGPGAGIGIVADEPTVRSRTALSGRPRGVQDLTSDPVFIAAAARGTRWPRRATNDVVTMDAWKDWCRRDRRRRQDEVEIADAAHIDRHRVPGLGDDMQLSRPAS